MEQTIQETPSNAGPETHKPPPPFFDAVFNGFITVTIHTALEFSLFDLLENTWLSSGEVAGAVGMEPRGALLLLNALVSIGYLQMADNKYSNSKMASELLYSGSPRTLQHYLLFINSALTRLRNLTDTLRQGKPALNLYDDLNAHPNMWDNYVTGSMELSTVLRDFVVATVPVSPKATALLDLGGNHGLYSAAFCRAHPQLKATIFDMPDAVERGRKVIDKAGMSGQVGFVGGDFLQDPLPAPQDVVTLINVIHTFTDAVNRELVRRAVETLRPGGVLAICNLLTNPGQPEPASALFGLVMYNETGGQMFSLDTVHDWMSKAGLEALTHHAMGMVTVVTGTKPV